MSAKKYFFSSHVHAAYSPTRRRAWSIRSDLKKKAPKPTSCTKWVINNLFSVLKRYNLSLAEFKQANPETDIPVKSGEIVFIPLHYMDESTAVLTQSPKAVALPPAATATEKNQTKRK